MVGVLAACSLPSWLCVLLMLIPDMPGVAWLLASCCLCDTIWMLSSRTPWVPPHIVVHANWCRSWFCLRVLPVLSSFTSSSHAMSPLLPLHPISPLLCHLDTTASLNSDLGGQEPLPWHLVTTTAVYRDISARLASSSSGTDLHESPLRK